MTKEELNRIEEAWWNTKEGIIAMAEVFRLAEKGLDQQKICADCNKKMDEIRRAYDNMLERKVEFDLKVCDMDEPEDVCCNCKHNIRTGEVPNIECHCDIDGSWLSYLTVMGHKCERWESDDKINGD